MDLVFQSIGGTEQTNRGFGIDLVSDIPGTPDLVNESDTAVVPGPEIAANYNVPNAAVTIDGVLYGVTNGAGALTAAVAPGSAPTRR